MAYLSWRYVERPFRDRNVFSTMKIYFLSVFGLIFFAIVGLLFHLNDGFPGRVVVQGSPKDKSIAAAIFNEWDFSDMFNNMYATHKLLELKAKNYTEAIEE